MKMYLGDVPVKALYMHTDTDDANDEYLGKYYHDGSWYEDAEFTIPWTFKG